MGIFTKQIVLMAVVLDPRYKLKLIKFFHVRIYDWEVEKVDEILTNLKVELGRLFEFCRAQELPTPCEESNKIHFTVISYKYL